MKLLVSLQSDIFMAHHHKYVKFAANLFVYFQIEKIVLE